jgi:hypothetical protein
MDKHYPEEIIMLGEQEYDLINGTGLSYKLGGVQADSGIIDDPIASLTESAGSPLSRSETPPKRNSKWGRKYF